MALGGARYVRYIVFAFFALAVFYFVSHSSYDPTSLRQVPHPPANVRPPPGPAGGKPAKSNTAPEVKDGSAQDQSKPPAVFSTSAAKEQPKPSAQPTSSSSGSPSATDGIYKHIPKPQDLTEAPLALSMDSPQWQNLDGIAPGPRMNATFVTLARNGDLWEIARSIRQIEDRFNHRYKYDWVFLNDKPFDSAFKKLTTSLVSGNTFYGEIAPEHWSFPEWIDKDKAEKVRVDMGNRKIIYGDSVSYRHMCRFESGFFFRQPLMMNYEYYWRVEPSVELFCDIHYDPFRLMHEQKKKYSFVISLYEYEQTIPTLWDSAKKFMKNHPEHIAEDNLMNFISDDNGEKYNHCHFWSNFEIGSLEWLRSKAYIDYFTSLDKDGGFFYERWGDAPVHSIAAALMLKKEEVHFFNDIAYYHVPFTHCPTGDALRQKLRCHCNPKDNFDWKGYSCTAKYFDAMGMEKPEGWESQRG